MCDRWTASNFPTNCIKTQICWWPSFLLHLRLWLNVVTGNCSAWLLIIMLCVSMLITSFCSSIIRVHFYFCGVLFTGRWSIVFDWINRDINDCVYYMLDNYTFSRPRIIRYFYLITIFINIYLLFALLS